MKTKHLILATVFFGVGVVSCINYLSSKLDAELRQEIQEMQESIDTEIVESYLTSQISKPIEI